MKKVLFTMVFMMIAGFCFASDSDVNQEEKKVTTTTTEQTTSQTTQEQAE